MEGKRAKMTAGILMGIGILFMVLGSLRGEASIMFIKAVNVCMECIGIG